MSARAGERLAPDPEDFGIARELLVQPREHAPFVEASLTDSHGHSSPETDPLRICGTSMMRTSPGAGGCSTALTRVLIIAVRVTRPSRSAVWRVEAKRA